MARAAKKIQSQNQSLARIRKESAAETATYINYASAMAGSVGAAAIDSKWGDGEEPAEMVGVPTNALVGVGAMVLSVLAPKTMPGKGVVGFAGVGMAGAALYRYSFDKLEEREVRKAQEAAVAAAAAQ